MSEHRLVLEWIPGAFAVCRMPPDAAVPDWALAAGREGFFSVTRTDRELSVIVSQDTVPAGVVAERGWTALRLAGTLDMTEVGVLSRLTGALAEAAVSVFVVSTYETDVLMVKAKDTARAMDALKAVADVSGL